jgi:hypothetical protein
MNRGSPGSSERCRRCGSGYLLEPYESQFLDASPSVLGAGPQSEGGLRATGRSYLRRSCGSALDGHVQQRIYTAEA